MPFTNVCCVGNCSDTDSLMKFRIMIFQDFLGKSFRTNYLQGIRHYMKRQCTFRISAKMEALDLLTLLDF